MRSCSARSRGSRSSCRSPAPRTSRSRRGRSAGRSPDSRSTSRCMWGRRGPLVLLRDEWVSLARRPRIAASTRRADEHERLRHPRHCHHPRRHRRRSCSRSSGDHVSRAGADGHRADRDGHPCCGPWTGSRPPAGRSRVSAFATPSLSGARRSSRWSPACRARARPSPPHAASAPIARARPCSRSSCPCRLFAARVPKVQRFGDHRTRSNVKSWPPPPSAAAPRSRCCCASLTHGFAVFALYRLALGTAVLALVAYRRIGDASRGDHVFDGTRRTSRSQPRSALPRALALHRASDLHHGSKPIGWAPSGRAAEAADRRPDSQQTSGRSAGIKIMVVAASAALSTGRCSGGPSTRQTSPCCRCASACCAAPGAHRAAAALGENQMAQMISTSALRKLAGILVEARWRDRQRRLGGHRRQR